MTPELFPHFLSVVCVTRNWAGRAESFLKEAHAYFGSIAEDYEIIVIDNGSDDASLSTLRSLCLEHDLPNTQVFALTETVSFDVASWAGLERSLGDFVIVINPTGDSLSAVPDLLKRAEAADMVFARNSAEEGNHLYRISYGLFSFLYKRLGGVHLAREAPSFRVLNKKLVNLILRHPSPPLAYRSLQG